MITNILKSSKNITPFGGLFFVINDLKNKGLAKLIDSHLGRRVKQAKYSYSDIILNWSYCNLCGAERLEDIEKLRDSLDIKLPSHDALGTVMKSFATETNIITNANITHQFNTHQLLNNLMLNTSLKLGLLNKNKSYILDYDNTIIETQKYDSTKTYTHDYGYQPGVSFIDKIPVYIEGRGGNSGASYKIVETIKKTLDTLDNAGIRINRFRSDAAACQMKLIRLLDNMGMEFFIRYRKSQDLIGLLSNSPFKWEPIMIGHRKNDVTSMDGTELENAEHPYRIVATRCKTKAGEYAYRAIVTNNEEMSDKEVVYFYNKRGAIERNFDDLKNNFNWGNLPFSFLNQNTVFLIISAIVSLIYQYLIRKFSKKVKFVKRKHRLKNFIFHFIVCSAILEDGKLKLFTDRDYSPLIQ